MNKAQLDLGSGSHSRMIAVLTYDYQHRKTQDLLFTLVANGEAQRVIVLATPWLERKNFVPLYPHRWFKPMPIDTDVLCQRLGVAFERVDDGNLVERLADLSPDMALIGGAGILPQEVLDVCPVINSHPGYLPNVRGLDALKWAILEGQPIGVTTHMVSEQADAGQIISRELVPLFYWDTFGSVAHRQFEMEVRMLAESIFAPVRLPLLEKLPAEGEVRRRMPHALELKLFDKLRVLLDERATPASAS